MGKLNSALRTRQLVLVATGSVGLLSTPYCYSADPPKKAAPLPDISFLEYLGSLETKDENWTDALNAEAVATDSADHGQQPKPITKSTSKAKKPEAANAMAESK